MLVITHTCLECFISERGRGEKKKKKNHIKKKHNMTVESTKERCVGGAHFERSQKHNKFNKNTLFLSSADFTDVHKNSAEEKKKKVPQR